MIYTNTSFIWYLVELETNNGDFYHRLNNIFKKLFPSFISFPTGVTDGSKHPKALKT